jgi:sugar/nucleoside kinase (ribokinase family)
VGPPGTGESGCPGVHRPVVGGGGGGGRLGWPAPETLSAVGVDRPAEILISNSLIEGIRTSYLPEVCHKGPVFFVMTPLFFLLLIVSVLVIA